MGIVVPSKLQKGERGSKLRPKERKGGDLADTLLYYNGRGHEGSAGGRRWEEAERGTIMSYRGCKKGGLTTLLGRGVRGTKKL